MLALVKVKEAERLLADGKLSYRKIAMMVGISRASVGAIASGTRPDYEARRAARVGNVEPLGPIMRCAQCGGLVYAPCRLCRVRTLKAQEQEVARRARRNARDLAARRLLGAVQTASRQDPSAQVGDHLPAALPPGASDCR